MTNIRYLWYSMFSGASKCIIVSHFTPFLTLYRQYEEKQLRGQQERAQRRLEFMNQISRLQNQLAYEKQRDTLGNVVLQCICIFY